MTESEMKEIRHGQRPVTDAVVDEVIDEARAVILAAPSVAGALARLHAFVDEEMKHMASGRGVDPSKMVNRTALKKALGI